MHAIASGVPIVELCLFAADARKLNSLILRVRPLDPHRFNSGPSGFSVGGVIEDELGIEGLQLIELGGGFT
jgi:hypothetical protein